MSWEVHEWMLEEARRQASSLAAKFQSPVWGVDDLTHEAILYAQERSDWRQMTGSRKERVYVAMRFGQYMHNLVTRDRECGTASLDALMMFDDSPAAPKGRVSPPRHHDNLDDRKPGKQRGRTYVVEYERDEVEALLPGVWDDSIALYGVQREERPDPDMPKGQGSNPAHGNTAAAKVADVQRAWRLADLTRQQRQAILCVYGAGMTERDAAAPMGSSQPTVHRLRVAGMDAILAFLNGS